MDSAQALHQFWSGFGLSAYDANSVPSREIQLPARYITYEVAESNFATPIPLTASLWFRETTWENITKKAEAIRQYLGQGGVLLAFDGGRLWIKRGNPFSQRMRDEDDSWKRIYINVEAEYFTTD